MRLVRRLSKSSTPSFTLPDSSFVSSLTHSLFHSPGVGVCLIVRPAAHIFSTSNASDPIHTLTSEYICLCPVLDKPGDEVCKCLCVCVWARVWIFSGVRAIYAASNVDMYTIFVGTARRLSSLFFAHCLSLSNLHFKCMIAMHMPHIYLFIQNVSTQI